MVKTPVSNEWTADFSYLFCMKGVACAPLDVMSCLMKLSIPCMQVVYLEDRTDADTEQETFFFDNWEEWIQS